MKPLAELYDLLESQDADLDALTPEERADVLAARGQEAILRATAQRYFASTTGTRVQVRDVLLRRVHRSRILDQWLMYGGSVTTVLVLTAASLTRPPADTMPREPWRTVPPPSVVSTPDAPRSAGPRATAAPPVVGSSPVRVVTPAVRTVTGTDGLDVSVEQSSRHLRFDQLRNLAREHERDGRALHAISTWRGLATIAVAEGQSDVADAALGEALRCARNLGREDLMARLDSLRTSIRR